MLSNLMPGDNSGAEPREHHEDCVSRCEAEDQCLCAIHGDDHECNCEDLRFAWEESQVEAELDRMEGYR